MLEPCALITAPCTPSSGAPLLGVQGAVIKAHGSSNAYAFCSAIKQCVKMIDGNVVKTIEKNVSKLLKEQEAIQNS